MSRPHHIFLLAALLAACGDSITGPKGPSAAGTVFVFDASVLITATEVVVRSDWVRFEVK